MIFVRSVRCVLRLVLVCTLLLSAACDRVPPSDRLTEGQAFPALHLPHFEGGATPVESYRGRLVVLNVWATWCPPCRAELPSLDRLAAQLDPRHFAVIGLSVDSDIDIAREFLRERQVGFLSYIDADQRISRDILEIRAYPITFIIGPQGRLLKRIVGEREWDAPGIVAALQAAFAGDTRALESL